MYYVYILTNKNNTVLYTGITNNLERRLFEHRNKPSGFVKRYNADKLIYFECTLIGCKTRGEVEEAVKYLKMTDEERDYSDAVKGFKGDWGAKCMYCNHCLPCPSGIDIAAVTRILDVASLCESALSQELRERYAALEHAASECIECGACEERCPFGVKVTDNMRNAAGMFE